MLKALRSEREPARWERLRPGPGNGNGHRSAAPAVCALHELCELPDQAAWAAIAQDLEKAREIQQHLIPREVQFPGLEVAISFEPCKWVGGDYADVVPARDGRTLLVVADISGKGLQAALVSSGVHSMVHACLAGGSGVVELMGCLNDYLCDNLPEGSFVTLACVAVDTSSGETEAISAGHPAVIVIEDDGARRPLRSWDTVPLGIDSLRIETRRDRIGRGQTLAMFTDGATDILSESGRMFGLDGLTKCLTRVCRLGRRASAWELASRVKGCLDRFRGSAALRDDCTLVLARPTALSAGVEIDFQDGTAAATFRRPVCRPRSRKSQDAKDAP